jgi:hypothetical protein
MTAMAILLVTDEASAVRDHSGAGGILRKGSVDRLSASVTAPQDARGAAGERRWKFERLSATANVPGRCTQGERRRRGR